MGLPTDELLKDRVFAFESGKSVTFEWMLNFPSPYQQCKDNYPGVPLGQCWVDRMSSNLEAPGTGYKVLNDAWGSLLRNVSSSARLLRAEEPVRARSLETETPPPPGPVPPSPTDPAFSSRSRYGWRPCGSLT